MRLTRPPLTPGQGAAIAAVGLVAGLLGGQHPLLGAGLVGAALLWAALRWAGARLARAALGLIGVSLIGYALLDKGFAYAGVPPVFIGEVTLALALLGAWQTRPLALRHQPLLLVLLGLFLGVGLLNTLPWLAPYGLDALRDAVVWVYALFALATAQLVLRLRHPAQILRAYARVVPYFLVFAPLSVALSLWAPGSIPVWPGSGVPIIFLKGGDLAVHLAGVMAFLMLGLGRWPAGDAPAASSAPHERREWLWWLLWLLGVLSVFAGRAAMVTVAAAAMVVLLFQPLSRWGRPLYLAALLLTTLALTNFEFSVRGRSLSPEGLLLNVQSVIGNTGTATRDGSRAWRLEWWQKIADYTVSGPHFWTGKGYGVNLADDDGFQVTADGSLRSPHSVHMTILARSGVPGLASWAALQGAFALGLIAAHRRARRAGRRWDARLFLWLLAYWAAFVVNGSFDVFLEGPQGGVWFWCLFGFGLACLERERRRGRLEDEPC